MEVSYTERLTETTPGGSQLLLGRLVPDFAGCEWFDAVQHPAPRSSQSPFPVVTAVFGASGVTSLDPVLDLSQRSARCIQHHSTWSFFHQNCGHWDSDVVKILQNAFVPYTFVGRVTTGTLRSGAPATDT